MKAKTILIAFGVLFALVIVFNTVSRNSPTVPVPYEAPKPDYGTEISAEVTSETFVKRILKAPTTAKFSDQSAVLTGEVWLVKGSVDSENSFGAMLRSAYSCQVKKDPEIRDKWLLVAPCQVGTR